MYTGLQHRRRSFGDAYTDESKVHSGKPGRAMLKTWVQALLAFAAILFLSSMYRSGSWGGGSRVDRVLSEVVPFGPVMVSYSYFEKDPGQLSNADFFIAVGMGISSTFTAPAATDFTVVISGDLCTPCKALLPLVHDDPDAALLPQLTWGKTSEGLSILQRNLNEGMDFAAHNVRLCMS